MIVLNCPSCQTPLLHDGEGVSVADFSVEDAENVPHPFTDEDVPFDNPLRNASAPPVPTAQGGISLDDIIDLRIALAASGDVNDFIASC